MDIGNGQKHSAKTVNVKIAITIRFLPSGSITGGSGCFTRIIIPNNTAKRNPLGLLYNQKPTAARIAIAIKATRPIIL